MKEFVEYLIKQLVDYPDQVVVHEFKSEATTFYEVKVAKGDMGRIIGSNGIIIQSIRLLVTNVARKNNQHVQIELVEHPQIHIG